MAQNKVQEKPYHLPIQVSLSQVWQESQSYEKKLLELDLRCIILENEGRSWVVFLIDNLTLWTTGKYEWENGQLENVYGRRIKKEYLDLTLVSYKLADSFVQDMDNDMAAIRNEVSSFSPWGETWSKEVGGFAGGLEVLLWKWIPPVMENSG